MNQKLTSVKIDVDLFEKFKNEAHLDKFTFQKLAERSIYLYLSDKDFKNKIQNQINLEFNEQ
jgi:hypothetical protein